MSPKKSAGIGNTLRALALSYPETTETHPWGECAIKVRDKTFLFLRDDAQELSLSVKLSASHVDALEHAFTEPTHYGLGKSGWVTARFKPGARVPEAQLRAWLDESFRNVAPKKIVAALDAKDAEPTPHLARKK
jgi:predicted DNA-binding protein (MmcQ/YjbR family)